MPELVNKVGKLVIARPVDALPDGYFTPELNAISIEQLRFTFEIEKNLSGTPNTANVAIYGLDVDGRSAVQHRPTILRLYAGYLDSDPELLIDGDIRYAFPKRDSANWITEIQIGEGARAIGEARLSRSYGRGSTPKDAVKDIAHSMGLKFPQNLSDARELLTELGDGLTLHGYSRDHLTKVLRPRGFKWSVQGGSLLVQRDNDTDDEELIVSQEIGLIDSPEFGTPKKPGQPPNVNAKMLLYPRMRPGRKIVLDSLTARGRFKVVRVKHTGDTMGPIWHTEIEAKPL